jgi:hypothetical protein
VNRVNLLGQLTCLEELEIGENGHECIVRFAWLLADEEEPALALPRELAQCYLLHSSLELNETAYLLGYEGANSFFRAFHEWRVHAGRAAPFRPDSPTNLFIPSEHRMRDKIGVPGRQFQNRCYCVCSAVID